MKSLVIKILSIFPYLLLISIYFFIINLQARKDMPKYQDNIVESEKESNIFKPRTENYQPNQRIKIEVIPYSDKN